MDLSAGGDIVQDSLKRYGKYPVLANALTNDGIVGYYEKTYRIQAPAVTITGRGDVGHAKARKFNFTPVVRLLVLKTNHDVDFIEHAINVLSIAIESTGVPQLTVPQLGEHKLYLPTTIEEEKAIGCLFLQLDDLIALQQKKYEKLQNVKKAMLAQMFPAPGATSPAVRFAGFTAPWQERRLGDALSLLKDGTHGTHADADDGPLLLSAKNIKNGKVEIDLANERRISLEDYKQIHANFNLKEDDVLLTIVGTIGECAKIDNPHSLTFQRSVAYLRANNTLNPDFLVATVRSFGFQKDLKDRQSISAQPGIYLGELANIEIFAPQLDEQRKIGKYFSDLDNLISLHQRKLEKLQNVKKACLEGMFV